MQSVSLRCDASKRNRELFNEKSFKKLKKNINIQNSQEL